MCTEMVRVSDADVPVRRQSASARSERDALWAESFVNCDSDQRE